MAILSSDNTDRLLWLGRYSERVYTTIHIFGKRYDSMLDVENDAIADYCVRQEIPNIYKSREDFMNRYCFDADDPNSIFSNLMRAYDNAIVLREEIGSESLAYIQLAVYAMNRAKSNAATLIELQRVNDDIVAFWGMADDSIDDRKVRNLIKIGKLIERIDLYARNRVDRKELKRVEDRLSARISPEFIHYSDASLKHLNYLVVVDPVDYDEVVREIENLVP